MPNIKSAEKRVLVSSKKKDINTLVNSSMKTAIKVFEKHVKEGNKELAATALKDANKKIDKALSAGNIKQNKAARDKSRITKLYNTLG